MSKYGLHAKLIAKEGQGDALVDILLQASKLVSTATGCKLYLISRDPEVPEDIWVTEVWNSKEDHDNALNPPEVKNLIGKAMPIISAPPVKGQELTILGGFGIGEV